MQKTTPTSILGETYEQFKILHPDVVIGHTKFCEFRPKHNLQGVTGPHRQNDSDDRLCREDHFLRRNMYSQTCHLCRGVDNYSVWGGISNVSVRFLHC